VPQALSTAIVSVDPTTTAIVSVGPTATERTLGSDQIQHFFCHLSIICTCWFCICTWFCICIWFCKSNWQQQELQ
jgi:hypothetical protein